MKKPVVLTIIDGFGLRNSNHGNAVKHAKMPNYEKLLKSYPNATLRADGLFVGLPEGQMGNSEVGHMNIGAGRVVYQSLVLINKAVEEKTYFDNAPIKKAMENAKNGALHIFGLLSNGGVHSHINHLFATLEMAKINNVKNVYVHAFLDGRDVDPKSGVNFVQQLQDKIDELGVGEIASISGRYYAMDRDKRWERVKLAYDAIVAHESDHSFTCAVDYVKTSYENNVYDEFVLPAVNSNGKGKICDNDSVVFINFRPDRATQLAAVLTNPLYNPKPEEPIFVPNYRPTNLDFVQMMTYGKDVIGSIAYVPEKLEDLFGETVSKAGKTQIRIAETEKYPHVTFFFDGGVDKEIPGAKRILINSPKVATYDLQPEMSAYEVKDALIEELNKGETDVVILNFANPDMVGHTGMMEPAIKACEAVDECLGEIFDTVLKMGGTGLITADHGNAETVSNEDDSPNTAHTCNPVPVILVMDDVEVKNGSLCDIAPTLLDMLNIDKPEKMTGKSLIVR